MSGQAQELKDLLVLLTGSLVMNPDEIQVDVEEDGNFVRLAMRCNPADMGKVIGRGGKRAQAIRTLMKAKSAQNGTRVVVDFVG